MVEDTPERPRPRHRRGGGVRPHPLGRPVIGSADVISSVSRRALAGTTVAPIGREDRRRGCRQRRCTKSTCADRGPKELLCERGRDCPAEARTCLGAALASLPAQGHRAVPRLSRGPASHARTTDDSRARSWTPSSVARRRPASSRRIERSAGWRTRCTGTRRSTRTPGRSACTWGRARTISWNAWRSQSRSSRTSRRGNVRADEVADREEEPQGTDPPVARVDVSRMTRLGKSTITEAPCSRPSEIVATVEAVTAGEVAELADEPSGPRAPLGRGDRAERSSLPPGRRARQPGPRREGGLVRVALYGGSGKVGACSPRARRAPDTSRRRRADGPAGCDAAIDFTRPDAVGANVDTCLDAGVPVVIGTTGFDLDAWTRPRARRASRASTRRTSRRGRS